MKHRNLWAAEAGLRGLGRRPTLDYALAYLGLLSERKV
jgi:hypothetical protein